MIVKAFTGTGDGPDLLLQAGQEFTYAVDGTFTGTVKLMQRINFGLTERTLLTLTAAQAGNLFLDTTLDSIGLNRNARVFWRCTAYTSGTINAQLAPVTEVRDALLVRRTIELTNNQVKKINTVKFVVVPPPAAGQLLRPIWMGLTVDARGGAWTPGADDYLFPFWDDAVQSICGAYVMNDSTPGAGVVGDRLTALLAIGQWQTPLLNWQQTVQDSEWGMLGDVFDISHSKGLGIALQGSGGADYGGGALANSIKVSTIYHVEDV